MGVIAGVIGTLAFVQPAQADGRHWVTATVGSYHQNRERGYNEFNYGLGIERALPWAKWRFAGGFYENSYDQTSWYALGVREVFSLWRFKIGVAGGLVTGYESGRVSPILVPILAWEGKRFGFNIFPVIPSVVGLQVKMRF